MNRIVLLLSLLAQPFALYAEARNSRDPAAGEFRLNLESAKDPVGMAIILVKTDMPQVWNAALEVMVAHADDKRVAVTLAELAQGQWYTSDELGRRVAAESAAKAISAIQAEAEYDELMRGKKADKEVWMAIQDFFK